MEAFCATSSYPSMTEQIGISDPLSTGFMGTYSQPLPYRESSTMNHLVLFGDSIFDNRAYVAGGPAVIDQLQKTLPTGWKASLLAVDGDTAVQVPDQIKKLPSDCTHLALSAGGNDALGCLDQMETPVPNLIGALGSLSKMLQAFEKNYSALITELMALQKPLLVCTIYDSVPGLTEPLKVALALFNDIILRSAIVCGVPVLDLRMICTEAGDYSAQSPIEPSSQGGAKLVDRMVTILSSHDFAKRGCNVYF